MQTLSKREKLFEPSENINFAERVFSLNFVLDVFGAFAPQLIRYNLQLHASVVAFYFAATNDGLSALTFLRRGRLIRIIFNTVFMVVVTHNCSALPKILRIVNSQLFLFHFFEIEVIGGLTPPEVLVHGRYKLLDLGLVLLLWIVVLLSLIIKIRVAPGACISVFIVVLFVLLPILVGVVVVLIVILSLVIVPIIHFRFIN